jgi:hypothetical protein
MGRSADPWARRHEPAEGSESILWKHPARTTEQFSQRAIRLIVDQRLNCDSAPYYREIEAGGMDT